jgi:hypothetical protein
MPGMWEKDGNKANEKGGIPKMGEMTTLAKAYKILKNNGFKIVGIGTHKSPYRFIAERDGKRFAIVVKHIGRCDSILIWADVIRNLASLRPCIPTLLVINSEESYLVTLNEVLKGGYRTPVTDKDLEEWVSLPLYSPAKGVGSPDDTHREVGDKETLSKEVIRNGKKGSR